MKEFGRMKRILFATSLLVGATLCGGTSTAMAQQPKHQTVTINAKSMSVKQFFAEVKKQTGLNFIYSTDLAAKLPHITVNATNRPLRQVLDEIGRASCRERV